MNIQKIVPVYQKEINFFIANFLKRKSAEAKKTAPETFYFIDAARKYILLDKTKETEPIAAYFAYKSFGGKNDKQFLNLASALFLICKFYDIHSATVWSKKGLKNKLVKDVFKKYQKDKTKYDPLHIAFSQSLILGDIVSGFGYELVLTSDFSDEQKIKIFEELNNIIKWRQIDELLPKPCNREKYLPRTKNTLTVKSQLNNKYTRDKRVKCFERRFMVRGLIEGPAKIGAIAAGEEDAIWLDRFVHKMQSNLF